jgi:hypothetical protein
MGYRRDFGCSVWAGKALRWLFTGGFIILLHTGLFNRIWAQDIQGDTLETPFQKGRWLSGLSGSFTSNTLKLASSEELFSTNGYGIEIFTGKFFKDRWFIGLNVLAASSSGAGLIERKSESLVLGPSLSHYFLKDSYGSLYVSVLPGFIRIREEGTVLLSGEVLNQKAEGPGFATRIRLGYSYVISRRIVLDVGVGTNLSWLDLSYSSELESVERQEAIFSNATFFSFGFNVLLDEFFF